MALEFVRRGNLKRMSAIVVTSLHIYPIKSFGGVQLESSEIELSGLKFDRSWMLVDPSGEFMTQRSDSRLALFRIEMRNEGMLVSHPGNGRCFVPYQASGVSRQATVWKNVCEAQQVNEEVDQWFSETLGQPCSLVRQVETFRRQTSLDYTKPGDYTRFADAFQILVAGEASLADLNSRLEKPLSMNRFRANIIVSGSTAFEEDSWSRFQLGGTEYRFAKICGRCGVTTTDQETAETGVEPLKTLATYRKFDKNVYFGAYFVPESKGIVHVGDCLEVISLNF